MASTVDAKRVQEYAEPSEESLETKIDQLAEMVRRSKYTVFYTGAGMSTSAGVGDYRGPSGAWTQRRIKELQGRGSSASSSEAEELRKLLTEQQKEQAKATSKVPMTDAQPTLSHMMQATLIRTGLAHFVVTTNLDGIYRKAGLQAQEDVCFLHGDVYTERCTSCGYDFERNFHVRQSTTHVHDHHVGTCSRCGSKPPQSYTGEPKARAKTGADSRGFMENRLIGTCDQNVGTKDTHINFGECLDDADWDLAELHCSKADLCIVMGTSMSLRHITHFPFEAKRTVIVNLQKTPDDRKCDLRIWAQCDPVSAGLLARLGLEPMPAPVWRPRDALPLHQLPSYVTRPYREAAERLMQLATVREGEAMAKVEVDKIAKVEKVAARRAAAEKVAADKAAAEKAEKAAVEKPVAKKVAAEQAVAAEKSTMQQNMEKKRSVQFIGLFGASGSGKTIVANEIAECVNSPLAPVQADWFFKKDIPQCDVCHRICCENPKAVDFVDLRSQLIAIRQVLESCDTLPEINIPVPYFGRGGTKELTSTSIVGTPLGADPVYVVVEGFLTFADHDLNTLFQHCLFLRIDSELAAQRRATRPVNRVSKELYHRVVWPHHEHFRDGLLNAVADKLRGGRDGIDASMSKEKVCLRTREIISGALSAKQ